MVTSVIRQPSGPRPRPAGGRGRRRGGPSAGAGRWSASRNVEHARPVAADEPQPAVDLVELGEVERDVVDVVLELVDERLGPAVADLALEQVGPHAARSRRRPPAPARRPRSPSGSRPRGSRSPGGRRRTTCRRWPWSSRTPACASSVRNVYSGWLNSRARITRSSRTWSPGLTETKYCVGSRKRLQPVHVVRHREGVAGPPAVGLVRRSTRPRPRRCRAGSGRRCAARPGCGCTRSRRGRVRSRASASPSSAQRVVGVGGHDDGVEPLASRRRPCGRSRRTGRADDVHDRVAGPDRARRQGGDDARRRTSASRP